MVFHAPAAYSIGKSLRRTFFFRFHSFKIFKKTAGTTPQFNFPGPGTYCLPENQTFRITSHSRKTANGRNRKKPQHLKKITATDGLGPGSYNIPQKNVGNNFT